MKKERAYSKNILYSLGIREISIEEIAEFKKVTVKTAIKKLRGLGYSIVGFRMWRDYERERERLVQLSQNHMLTDMEAYERDDEMWAFREFNETTEGGRPMGDLFDINDPESDIEYEKTGTRIWVPDGDMRYI